MPKDDSFYEDHTNRLWASWERANALNFYDSEEEERYEQELQEMRWASWQSEQERMRRWQLLHPPKPPPSSDEEDDITFEELEDAVTQLDSTGAINWNSLTARTREPQRSHAAPVFYDSDEEARSEMEEQIRRDRAYFEKIASWRVGHPPADISSMPSRETQRAQMADNSEQRSGTRQTSVCSLPARQHNPPVGQPCPLAWQFNQPRPDGNWPFLRSMVDDNISKIYAGRELTVKLPREGHLNSLRVCCRLDQPLPLEYQAHQ